jgi:hypothetical protein
MTSNSEEGQGRGGPDPSSDRSAGQPEQGRSPRGQAWSDRAEDLANWVWAILKVREEAGPARTYR